LPTKKEDRKQEKGKNKIILRKKGSSLPQRKTSHHPQPFLLKKKSRVIVEGSCPGRKSLKGGEKGTKSFGKGKKRGGRPEKKGKKALF